MVDGVVHPARTIKLAARRTLHVFIEKTAPRVALGSWILLTLWIEGRQMCRRSLGLRWHALSITHNFRSEAIQSRRDCGTKPKVARNEPPWVSPPWIHNRNAVAFMGGMEMDDAVVGSRMARFAKRRNPFRVAKPFCEDPRVGARSSRQLWALRRNPVGI